MKYLVSPPMRCRKRRQVLLNWSQYFFFIVGILTVDYVAFTVFDVRFYQAKQAGHFQEAKALAAMAANNEEIHSASLPAAPLKHSELESRGPSDLSCVRIEFNDKESRLGLETVSRFVRSQDR
jgi:hypothetical protein